jgi:ribosomal-protein-alanine N-acetyltransferase
MRPDDIHSVLALERELFGAEAWSAGMFRDELAEPSRWYQVATQGPRLIGYAGLCAYPDEAFVQTLAVRADRWGQGVGSRLLEALLVEAGRRGNPVIGLEVRADNERAQRLYLRFGFRPVGIRRRYYQPSGTDALVMQRRATLEVG